MTKRIRGPVKQLWVPEAAWFWRAVNHAGPVQPHMSDPCWVWTRYLGTKGYGAVQPTTAEGRRLLATLQAHRVAWELERGPIPEGSLVCHHCDNRACVRPSHLFIGDDKANADDMVRKNRHARAGGGRHEKRAKGERQHLAKLTEDDVREIRRLRPHTSLKELAGRFGVSLVAVSCVALGKTWKHVRDPT